LPGNKKLALAASGAACYKANMETKSQIALRAYIQERGLTQREFAESIAECECQVSRWLRGKVRPCKGMRKYLEVMTDRKVTQKGWFIE